MLALLVALLLQAAPDRPVLWEGVPAGLSAEEIRALHPAGDHVRHADDRVVIRRHAVSDDCRAEVNILHPAGRVEGVVLRGEPSIAGLCGDAMLAMLRTRYGAPASTERRRPLMRRARTTYVWHAGGLTIRYVHYAAGSGALAVVDATNHSWELSVTAGERPTSS
jgi:hypothetical protein